MIQPWSHQARERLREEQEWRYAYLGRRAGLGGDPQRAHAYFCSDPMPASAIAPEQFAKTVASKWGHDAGWGTPAGAADAIDRFRNVYQQAELPTPYEDPNWYPMLLAMADAIERAAASASYQFDLRPLFGSLPSGKINAAAVRLEDTGEYLVLFERGLLAFAFQMAKLMAQALPPIGPKGSAVAFADEPDPARVFAQRPDLLRQFVDILTAYTVRGNPSQIPRYDLNREHLDTALLLLGSMESFVMGHEYAHILCGHLERQKPMSGFGGGAAAGVQRNWQEEFAADQVGFSLGARVMTSERVPLMFGYWGAAYFLSCMDILERCLGVLANGSAPDAGLVSDTHPPLSERRARLRGDLPELAAAHSVDDVKACVELDMRLQAGLEQLWQRGLPQWVEMHEEGVRPSSLWL